MKRKPIPAVPTYLAWDRDQEGRPMRPSKITPPLIEDREPNPAAKIALSVLAVAAFAAFVVVLGFLMGGSY
jgi:hypothetical protein